MKISDSIRTVDAEAIAVGTTDRAQTDAVRIVAP